VKGKVPTCKNYHLLTFQVSQMGKTPQKKEQNAQKKEQLHGCATAPYM
jgi:hypothetical protein